MKIRKETAECSGSTRAAAWILFPAASFWTQLALSVVVCVFVSWFGGTGSAIASTRMVAESTVKKTRTSKQQRVKLKWGRVFELMVEHGLAGEEGRLHQQVPRLESALWHCRSSGTSAVKIFSGI